MAPAAAAPAARPPVVPAWLLHPTDQRLLFLSLFVLLQASKLAACLLPSASGPASVAQWAAADAAFVLAVGALRVPRLSWGVQGRAAAVALLVGADWLLLAGGWRSIPFSALLPSTLTSALTFYPTLSASHARLSDILRPKEHLSGAFELVITPFSTARLLQPPTTLPCLSDRTKEVPLALHFSTMPGTIEYALSLPAEQGGAVVLFNVSASALELVKPRRSSAEEASEDEDDDEDEAEVDALLAVRSSLAARKALVAGGASADAAAAGVTLLLPVRQPGTVRLSRVFPPSGSHAFRIPLAANEGVRVHRCPSVSLVPPLPADATDLDARGYGRGILAKSGGAAAVGGERCVGEKDSIDLVVRGEGGITVGWSSVDGQRRQASGSLNGIGLDDPASGAADKSFLAPLPLTFDVAGKKTYRLTTLSSPHVPTLLLDGQAVEFTVLPIPSVSFAPTMACSATRPLVLANPAFVRNAKPVHLTVLSPEKPLDGHAFRANLSFTPAAAAGAGAEPAAVGLTLREGQNPVRIDQHGEGLWRIESVGVDGAGGRCGGDVKEPRECRVVWAPVPKLVRYDVRKLEDDCAGEQGVTVSFVLLGQAPFKLTYSLSTTPFAASKDVKPRPTVQQTVTLLSNTGDVTLRPEVEGEYVYSLVSLSDDRYHDGVAVAGEVRGSVRPVATADFGLRPGSAVGSGRGLERQLRLWECEARQVELDVSVGRGSPPFALEFLTSTAADSKAETVTLGSVGTHWLTLPVPTELAAAGGNYTIGLSGIRDGNGCSRKLDKQPVRVEVRVGRPTAKIAGSAADRVLVVTEGTTVNVPLRLTGEGPWTVKYQSSKLSAPIEEKIRAANTDFAFRDAAVYKLLSVRDSHCEGSILTGQDTFEIRHLPKPSVSLQVDEGAAVSKRKSWMPKGVCVGTEDHVALHFDGQAPFEVGYSVTRSSGKTHKDVLRAIGGSTTFALDTADPGRYTYSFDRVGDRNYALAPLGSKITFDHEVYGRPSAMWLSTETVSVCANSRLTPATLGPSRGMLALKGKAPFAVTLHISTPKSAHPVVRTVGDIHAHEWPVAVDDFEFSQLGQYTVSVESVSDASGCAQDLAAEGVEEAKAFRVEVAETASVVQVQKVEDVCVGQSLDFLLQGSPPWTLTTTFNGAERQITEKDGKFSRLADVPGTFALTSIAHQRNQCRVPVTDIVRRVHALPSARVKAGKHFVETVEEGEQAEIVFEFEGEAPFSFTYTWSTSGRLPRVLETHTVSGILDSSYSIFASAEGVWKVTEIEDRWCRFPPLAAARSGAKPASLLEGIEVFPPLTAP